MSIILKTKKILLKFINHPAFTVVVTITLFLLAGYVISNFDASPYHHEYQYLLR